MTQGSIAGTTVISTQGNVIGTALISALIKARGAFAPVLKSRAVDAGKYSYTYAPLDVVMEATLPALTAHGLILLQPLMVVDGQTIIRTILAHVSGESMSSDVPVPAASSMQDMGKAITYLRRYAYVSLLGLATEDDDDAGGVEVPRHAGNQIGSAGHGHVARPAANRPDSAEPYPYRGHLADRKAMFAAIDAAAIGIKECDDLGLSGKGRAEMMRAVRLNWIQSVALAGRRKITSSSDLSTEDIETVTQAAILRAASLTAGDGT